MSRVKVFPKSRDGCSFYRLEMMAELLDDVEIDFSIAEGKPPSKFGAVNMFQRVAEPGTMAVISFLKKQGRKVLLEQDDNFQVVNFQNPLFRKWPQDKILRNNQVFGMVDRVSVSTPEMAKAYSPFQSNIHTIINNVDLSKFPAFSEFQEAREERRKTGIINIGFAGSYTHLFELHSFCSMFNSLAEISNVRILIYGFDPNLLYVQDKPEGTEVFNFPYTVVPWQPDIKEYYRSLMEIDIGLAICYDNKFNRCKSDLKFLEYSACGIPTVAIGPPYTKVIRNGENGYLAKHEGDMLRKITSLVKDSIRRGEFGLKAREYIIKKRQIQDNILEWQNFFNFN